MSWGEPEDKYASVRIAAYFVFVIIILGMIALGVSHETEKEKLYTDAVYSNCEPTKMVVHTSSGWSVIFDCGFTDLP
jgi:hypothetical protein